MNLLRGGAGAERMPVAELQGERINSASLAKTAKTLVVRPRRLCLVFGCVGLLAGSLFAVQAAHALSPLMALGGYGSRNAQGYLGVNFRDAGEDSSGAKTKGARGAEIVLVDHDGPGCRSGLREHDIILQLDGKIVENESKLRHMLKELPADRTVTFVIEREGQQQTISTQLANRETVGQEAWERHITVPEPASESYSSGGGSSFIGNGDVPRHSMGAAVVSSSYTGALLEMMGPQLSDYFGTQMGLLVRSVDPDSPAAIAGMRAGDVVVRLNAMQVT
ncbi:MAG: PDZ domain-containing protein, partial [Granulicella sp.]